MATPTLDVAYDFSRLAPGVARFIKWNGRFKSILNYSHSWKVMFKCGLICLKEEEFKPCKD